MGKVRQKKILCSNENTNGISNPASGRGMAVQNIDPGGPEGGTFHDPQTHRRATV
jgi:hypothetical protein